MVINQKDIAGYRWENSALTCAHDYLLPTVFAEMERLKAELIGGGQLQVFELGCGNGSVAKQMANHGWEVTGIDPSTEGIAQANASYPQVRLEIGSAYDDLSGKYGTFPVVRGGPGNLDKQLSVTSATTNAQQWAQHGAENGKRNKTETYRGIQSKSCP